MELISEVKKAAYFLVASYFAFFAKVVLRRWKPRIIVITGSNGKTTLLHMVASQLGDRAKYSYHANSAIGIPFDILGIHRQDLTFKEWPLIFVKAPLMMFRKVPKENIYIVEADCDRPNEGKFLGELLRPEVTLWVDVSRTHGLNFERVAKLKRTKVEKVIAKEFGNYAKNTTNLIIANGDNKYIRNYLAKLDISKELIKENELKLKYEVDFNGTKFTIEDKTYRFKYLLPKESFYQITLTKRLVKYLGFEFDQSFKNFEMPPGRSSVLKAIKSMTIIDSTYNASLSSMRVVLNMFSNIRAKNKWIVLGDMVEQGHGEVEEHKKLAKEILKHDFDKVILMGPRVTKYTKPYLSEDVQSFLNPKEVLNYLRSNLTGGEVILFKGARFLEGVIENLLLDKSDAKYLVRREKVWQTRRKRWGL